MRPVFPTLISSVLGSWVITTRDTVGNKERWKRRRTPTQDPSTDLAAESACHARRAPGIGMALTTTQRQACVETTLAPRSWNPEADAWSPKPQPHCLIPQPHAGQGLPHPVTARGLTRERMQPPCRPPCAWSWIPRSNVSSLASGGSKYAAILRRRAGSGSSSSTLALQLSSWPRHVTNLRTERTDKLTAVRFQFSPSFTRRDKMARAGKIITWQMPQ